MPSDARAVRARELHRRAAESERLAGQYRAQRDELIRELRADGWTYPQIAAAIGPGCSQALVSHIVTRRVGPGTRGRKRA